MIQGSSEIITRSWRGKICGSWVIQRSFAYRGAALARHGSSGSCLLIVTRQTFGGSWVIKKSFTYHGAAVSSVSIARIVGISFAYLGAANFRGPRLQSAAQDRRCTLEPLLRVRGYPPGGAGRCPPASLEHWRSVFQDDVVQGVMR